ncbi:sigma-70 family RNA polymerase sigma factor [Micromonospora endolithica]|uniref:sigma-70 family RNA polymerase sigma factor n=1 Tax=Micromonospora endolithica TaxID=230091 RepID=UPI0011ABA59E|nr:sigma-70 family RNA polymerase sigma factor [Micromonospora endolithica]TWJ21604.1 RNA polymerase sigma factor (sigma-70 family) [Micromonospora endolithica]
MTTDAYDRRRRLGPDDDGLVAAARGGDRAALDALLRAYLPLVYNVAARSLDRADAEDVAQETMLRAVAGLDRLRDPGRFRSWLVAIALRETRRFGGRRGADQRWRADEGPEDLPTGRPGPDDDAVRRVEMARQRRHLAAGARWLDADDRELLHLWWLTEADALDRAELPAALGISPAHTRVRLQRLRERLRTARLIAEAIDAVRSPDGCDVLRALLRGWDGRPAPVWRKRIARHLDGCAACGGADLLPPERLLAAVPLLVPPVDLAGAVVERLAGAVAASGPSGGAAAGGGSGPAGPAVAKAGAAVLAVVAVVLAVGMILVDPPGRPERAIATAPTRPGSVPAATSAAPVRPTPSPAAPAGPVAGAGTGGPTWSAGQLAPRDGGRYLYVSGRGDDGNDGRSRAEPLRTLRRAAQLTEPGDTVLVDDGEYVAPGRPDVLPIERSGTADRWITWAALPGARPVVRTTSWNGIRIRASYVTVAGFTVTGLRDELSAAQREAARRGDTSDPAISGNCLSVAELRNADPPRRPHHVVVWGNTVTDCPLNGISAQFADHVTIAHNVAARNAWWSPLGGSGISVKNTWNSDNSTGVKMVVRGNVTYDNQNLVPSVGTGKITDGNGIIVESTDNTDFRGAPLFQTPYAGRTLVENNVSYRNGGRGINVFRTAHVDVVNNTLYRNAAHPDIDIDLAVTDSRDVQVVNNVVVPGPASPAAAVSRSTRVRFDHNLLVGRTLGVADAARLGGDPRFVDPAAGDFRLRPGSPAVDSGAEGPATDVRRVARTGRVDRGAFESG